MQQEGAGACKLPLHAPTPSVLPPFACCVAHKGGRAPQGGEEGGARKGVPHLPHGSASLCHLCKWGGGGQRVHRPAPVPCWGANERPPFTHEWGWAKGVVGGLRSLSCASHQGLGSKGRAYLSHAAQRPLFAPRGGVVRTLCMEGGGNRGGPQWGTHRQGPCSMRGVCLHPYPPCTPLCVRVFLQMGEVAASTWKQEEGGEGGGI
jgi:hypothetical protein